MTAAKARSAKYKTTYLKDYQQPSYLIEEVELSFDLGEQETLVTSHMQFKRNNGVLANTPLVLDGEHLELVSIKLGDNDLPPGTYSLDDKSLTISDVPDTFNLTVITRIKPQDNTELSGLYKSNGIFCTQCEAQGFRRITYFLDRPDVMARYTTHIIADPKKYPVMLSNGNKIKSSALDNHKLCVTWQDPFPKPSYLFALVAGNLEIITDNHTYKSGKQVEIWAITEAGQTDKAKYAIECVQKAMAWDAEKFDREYDLQLYMIVAISDFNMGAMENKGLNIFNTKYILANRDIATDHDYEAILGVIGHEYFHNWTGNRITCRDWFQLSLKEGLTVFRDQEFTADMTSRAVKRIGDVRQLRSYQFAEDKSPMAHPVRPESYIEINNFYTMTIYEKGAEVIRMIQTLVNREGFKAGMDLYFATHDGQAVTVEDFVRCFEKANHIDLTQFRLWYSQAGTPLLKVTSVYDSSAKTYTLDVAQTIPKTSGQDQKHPMHIPIKMSLLDAQGKCLPLQLQGEDKPLGDEHVLELKQAQQQFVFTNVSSEPIPSLLHDFSAPVNLEYDYNRQQLALLIRHAPNLFARWEAMQNYFMRIFKQLHKDHQDKQPLQLNDGFVCAIKQNLLAKDLDPAFIAELLTLPSEKYIATTQQPIDTDAIHAIREFIVVTIAEQLKNHFLACYQELHDAGDYHIDHHSIAKRRLKNVALGYLAKLQDEQAIAMCVKQFESSNNMTDNISALMMLANTQTTARDHCLADYYQRWQGEPLAIDKWFSIQAVSSAPDTFDRVLALTKHKDFNIKNPNRLRSLISAFCQQNLYHFHRIDGKGYKLLADFIIKLNLINSQIAARLMTPLLSWRQYDEKRSSLMQEQIIRIKATKDLSEDVYELVEKALK